MFIEPINETEETLTHAQFHVTDGSGYFNLTSAVWLPMSGTIPMNKWRNLAANMGEKASDLGLETPTLIQGLNYR